MVQVITSAKAAPPAPFLSQAQLHGDLMFLSGTCAQNEKGEWVEGDVKAHTTQILTNIKAILAEAGLGMDNLAAVTIYLSKYTQDFENMNEAYIAAFPKGCRMPTRTCIGVANLPKGTDIEITCTAVRPAKL